MPDLIPNDGELYQMIDVVPEERKEQEHAEFARLNQSIPVIEEILTWLDGLIESCGGIDDIDLSEKHMTVKQQIAVQKILRSNFIAKRSELQNMQLTYREALKENES